MLGLLTFFIGLGLFGLLIFGVLVFFASIFITMSVGSMIAISLNLDDFYYTLFMILFCVGIIFVLGVLI